MSALVCRLTRYEDLHSARTDEKWCRFYFTTVADSGPGQPVERVQTSYRVDVSSNRALKARTARLGLRDLEKMLYWRSVQGLTRSLGIDPSVREIRTALRWRTFLEPEAARLRFPNPEPFEVDLPEPQTQARRF